MDIQATLTKAIEKAIANGWDRQTSQYEYISPDDVDQIDGPSIEEVIFNQSFAMALWGEVVLPMAADPRRSVRYERWKTHLQNMVIAPDPIKYLGEHI